MFHCQRSRFFSWNFWEEWSFLPLQALTQIKIINSLIELKSCKNMEFIKFGNLKNLLEMFFQRQNIRKKSFCSPIGHIYHLKSTNPKFLFLIQTKLTHNLSLYIAKYSFQREFNGKRLDDIFFLTSHK